MICSPRVLARGCVYCACKPGKTPTASEGPRQGDRCSLHSRSAQLEYTPIPSTPTQFTTRQHVGIPGPHQRAEARPPGSPGPDWLPRGALAAAGLRRRLGIRMAHGRQARSSPPSGEGQRLGGAEARRMDARGPAVFAISRAAVPRRLAGGAGLGSLVRLPRPLQLSKRCPSLPLADPWTIADLASQTIST